MDIDENLRIKNFLSSKRLGTLATISHDSHAPELALVYYVIDDSFRIFIVPSAGSRKIQNIEQDNKVAFLVGQEVEPIVVQIEGYASVVIEAEVKTMAFELLAEAANANSQSQTFPPLINLTKGKGVEVLQIIIKRLKYSDFSIDGSPVIFEQVR